MLALSLQDRDDIELTRVASAPGADAEPDPHSFQIDGESDEDGDPTTPDAAHPATHHSDTDDDDGRVSVDFTDLYASADQVRTREQQQ